MTTVIKKTTLAVALVLVMAACGPGERSEVVTNSGGILDCPSDAIQYTYLSMDTSQPGGETPVGSLQQIGVDSGLPEGTPREESPGMLVFEDSSGNRVGRVETNRFDTGWFVESTERCG